LSYQGPDWHPGSAGEPVNGTGPVVFARTTAAVPVEYVQASKARSLCGQPLDWVEALRR
jgi:hypothetical protein